MAHTIYVHNYHLDGYGHVNNARYLEFLEEARWAFFRQHALLPALRHAHLVVARMDIRYRRAAVLDDELHIHSRVLHAQSRQIKLHQQIIIAPHGQIAAEADVTLMPTHQGAIVRLHDDLLHALTTLIHAT